MTVERIPLIQAELREEIKKRGEVQAMLRDEIQARKAEQAANKRRFRGFLVGYLAFVVAIIGVWTIGEHDTARQRDALVRSGSAVAVDGCNRDFDSIQGIRAFLQRAKDLQQRQADAGVLTQEQAARGVEFYDLLLDSYPLPDCRLADDVVTANPTDVPDIPVARYPGDRR